MSVRTLCGTYWGEAPVMLCVVQSLTVSRWGMRAGALDSACGPLGDGICQTPPGSRVVAAGERRCAFAFVREDAGGLVEKLGVMNVMPRGA